MLNIIFVIFMVSETFWGLVGVALAIATAGLAATYGIITFGPKLALQNKVKAMKTKVKELMLAHNNQIIS
jgi:hypothetical protein